MPGPACDTYDGEGDRDGQLGDADEGSLSASTFDPVAPDA